MSTEYILLIPDVEAEWAAKSEDEKNAVFAQHRDFQEALAARGHQMVGGAELAPPSSARTVRTSAEGLRVTEGPYSETVEQLSGFYLVRTDDVDDLLQCVGLLSDPEIGIEVRECLGGSE